MSQIDVLLEAYELKDELRSGWQLRKIADPESVAAHTWGTATLCLLFADEAGIDRGRAVSMALVHDLAEARSTSLKDCRKTTTSRARSSRSYSIRSNTSSSLTYKTKVRPIATSRVT